MAPFEAGLSTDYYVDAAQGNDGNHGHDPSSAWKTVAKVNAAPLNVGDTVLFKRGGVWTGTQLVIASGVTYTAYGSGDLPIVAMITPAQYAAYTAASDHFTLSYLRFESVDGYTVYLGAWHGGAEGDGIDHAILDHLEISGGLFILGAYNLVQNSEIDGTINDGFNGTGIFDLQWASHDNQYLNNIIHDFTLWGIHSMSFAHDNIYRGNIIYNIGYDTGGQAIDFDGAGTVVWRHLAENNTVYHCNYGIQSENGFDCIIQNNVVYDCKFVGIAGTNYADGQLGGENLQYGGVGESRGLNSNLNIRQNIIYNCLNGVFIRDVGQAKVNANTIFDCSEYAVVYYSAYSVNNELISNIILENFTSQPNHGQVGLPGPGFTMNGFVDNHNILYKAGETYAYIEKTTWNLQTLAQYQALTGLGQDSLEADPLLVDPGNDDFHLQAGSPAISAGIDCGLTTDLDGVIHAIPPAIGVYEYV